MIRQTSVRVALRTILEGEIMIELFTAYYDR